jgi:MFS transporter, DHA2 family, multidrug resistance protein
VQVAITIPRRDQEFAVAEIKQSPQSGARLLAICVAASFAMLVDGTAANIINSGIPYLQGVLAATPDQASWIVTSFNAAYYSTILFSPWVYARIGRKPLLLTGLIGYSAISLALLLAHSLSVEIVLRFLQGVMLGCVFVPAASLLFTSLPLALLPFAPPYFATIVLGSTLMGSVIGGYFSENYGGPEVYLPGAVATLIATALVYFAAPSTDTPQRRLRPDLVGLALSVIAFGALQYLANEGERRNWFDDPAVITAAALLAVAGPAFVLWELGAATPHVNFRLLAQKRNLAVGGAVNVVLGLVGYSVLVFVQYLETQIQATETLAGAMIFLRLVTYIIGIIIAFALVKQRILGVRAVICIAAVGTALTFFAYGQSMTTTAQTGSFVVISLVFGLFFSMLSQPVPALVLGTLGLADLPMGLAIYKVSAPVGLSIGTAIFQTLIDHRHTLHASLLAAQITPARAPVQQFLEQGGHLRTLASLVGGQAQSLAYQDAMIGFAAIVLLVIPIIFFADLQARPNR